MDSPVFKGISVIKKDLDNKYHEESWAKRNKQVVKEVCSKNQGYFNKLDLKKVFV